MPHLELAISLSVVKIGLTCLHKELVLNFDEKYIQRLEVDNERLESVIESLNKEISELKLIAPSETLKQLELRLTASKLTGHLIDWLFI